MSSEPTEKEIQIATKLMSHGLSKAGMALQSVLNSPISIDAIDFSIVESSEDADYCTKKNTQAYLLKTVLVGELKGVCHLVFSEDEVEKIYSKCLPESVLITQSAQNDMMKEGFLTEIDNIVAAAVITQFANYLDLNVYGGVPTLQTMDAEVINDYITNESLDLKSIIKFKAHMQASELDIYPDFIWLLDDGFIEKIKSIADSSSIEELLNKK